MTAWYKQWFADSLYLEVYRHRDAAEARQAVDLFESVSGLPILTSRILDLACGTGRHAFELGRRGYSVAAVDLNFPLLLTAQRRTRKFGKSLNLICADMRGIPFAHVFDAVIQLFTAFGYFSSDEENATVIAEVAKALKPAGIYMLDFLNSEEVLARLNPYSEEILENSRIIQERRVWKGRVEKQITVIRNGETEIFNESVRLFRQDELKTMLDGNGFEIMEVFGDYSGGSFLNSSPRCILFAKLRS